MKKTVILTDEVVDKNGIKIAEMSVALEGDGKTPIIQTVGTSKILGFRDDGTAIIGETDDKLIEKHHQELMAEAIKEQKELSKANGIDPLVVNMINAEKENINE